MDRQIRRLGFAFVALFALLFAQVAYIQVFAANRIADEPANAARQIRAEYSVERGQILAADERTVLAESIKDPDPNSVYRFLRKYPGRELYGQLTGYYSRIYGLSGLEDAMNPYLSGTAPEFTAQNLTDILLGRPKVGGTVLTTIVPSLQRSASTLQNLGNEICHVGTTTVTMAQAFEQSCNVTFGLIGLHLGAERLSAQAHRYGFCPILPPNQVTCAEPTIPFILPWNSGRFPESSYFNENLPKVALSAVGLDNDKQNPLQLALESAAIANGGLLYAPRLVTEVRDSAGRTIKLFDKQEYGRPITPHTADQMRQMMINVVTSGTGTAAQIPGTTVAGKTGTATNCGPVPNCNVPPNAWFTAFAPAGSGQTPTIAVAVIVLDGGNLGSEATSGLVAAPIAKQLIQA